MGGEGRHGATLKRSIEYHAWHRLNCSHWVKLSSPTRIFHSAIFFSIFFGSMYLYKQQVKYEKITYKAWEEHPSSLYTYSRLRRGHVFTWNTRESESENESERE